MANFGLIGLIVVCITLVVWVRNAGSIAPWAVALLIGSNGIAYLLVFPVSLIWWSAIACDLTLSISSSEISDNSPARARLFSYTLVCRYCVAPAASTSIRRMRA